jgi:hypothetical protein
MNLYFFLGGESSPIENKAAIANVITSAAAYAGLNAIDLTHEISGTIGFNKVIDMVLDNQGVWVINDTFLLHIFPNGFPCPYVQISRDAEWLASSHSKNTIGHFTQSMLEAPQGLAHLISVLKSGKKRTFLGHNTYHVANDYKPKDVDTVGRFGLAAASWAKVTVIDPNYTFSFFEQEDLPYVWDIFQACDDNAPEGSLCIFTNRDICLTPESIGVIRAWMFNTQLRRGFTKRIDTPRFDLFHHSQIADKTPYPGADTFFWKKGFLPDMPESFKSLLLGRVAWDSAFMDAFGGPKAYMPFNVTYHMKHDSDWQHSDSATNGNKHNLNILSKSHLQPNRAIPSY